MMTARYQLARAQNRYDRARTVLDTQRIALHAAIVDAVESGELSQADVARELGWPRQQVYAVVRRMGGN
jgi:hypothetical protein